MDSIVVLTLSSVALVVRMPHLWVIPSLTDEANEVLRGVAIARGEHFPLTNVASYIGSLFNYALAALFVIFGPSPELPRLFVAVIGALTVGASYLLGRDLVRTTLPRDQSPWLARSGGALAAALLLVNGGHVLVNSHVAWSHSTTPLFVTLGLWMLHRALADDSTRALWIAALLMSLAVQTHTTAVALLPGVVLVVLLRRPRWMLRWRLVLGLALLFVAINANFLVYNLVTGGESIDRASLASEAYARGVAPGPDLVAANVERLSLGLARVTAGAVDVRDEPGHYFRDPLVWLAGSLALAGAAYAAGRRDPLVVCIVVPYVLLFSFVNSKYQVVPNARYLTPVAPLVFASIAVSLATLLAIVPPRARWPGGIVAILLSALLVVGAFRSLQARVDQLGLSFDASHELARAVDLFESRWDGSEPVALDPDLEKLWLDGGGDYRRALGYHLTLRGADVGDLETRPRNEQGFLDSCGRNRIELRYVSPAFTPRAPRLVADDPDTPVDESLQPYWLYRTVQPRDRDRDARRGQSDEWSEIAASYTPPLSASARGVDRCAPGLLI